MSKPPAGARFGAARESGNAIARSAADWLYLAAAPTFAVMALLTGVLGGPADALCSSGASPIVGMTSMYWLMSAFHLAPWLRLLANRRSGAGARANLAPCLSRHFIERET